jgi:hypothetical protein
MGELGDPITQMFMPQTQRVWSPGDPDLPGPERKGHWETEQLPRASTAMSVPPSQSAPQDEWAEAAGPPTD